MEVEKNKSKGSVVVIVILTILVIALGGYIGYDKFLNKNNTSTTEENSKNETNTKNKVQNSEEEIKTEKVKGECPLTKFDRNYVLTDVDKEEIIESLESLDVGFAKQNIDIDSLAISMISEDGYYFNVKFDCIPNTGGTFAEVVKVNNKFKVLNAGSGDTTDGIRRMEDTLRRICS